MKLEIISLRDQVKGNNRSHIGPSHNVVHKLKINLPSFNGESNRYEIKWISKIEKYFEMYNIYGDDDKLTVTGMYMDKTTCD